MDPSDQEASAAANAFAMGIATELQNPENPPPDVLSHNNVTEGGSLLEVTEANAVNMHSISVTPLDTVAYQEVYYEEVLTTSPAMLVHVQFDDHTLQAQHNEYNTIQTVENTLHTEHIAVQVQDGTIALEENTLHTLGNLEQTRENGMQAEDYIAENLLQTEENIMQTEYSTMQTKDNVLQTEDNTMQTEDGSIHVEDSTMHEAIQTQDNVIHHTMPMEEQTVQLQEHATQLENSATQLVDKTAHLEHNATQMECYATHLEGNTLPIVDHIILIPKDSSLHSETNSEQTVYSQVPTVHSAIHIEDNMVHIEDDTVHIEDHTVHIEDHTVRIEENTIHIEDNSIQTVNTEVNSVDIDDAEQTVDSEVQKKRKLPVSTDGEPTPKRKRGRKKKALSVGAVSEDISLPSEALTDPDVELGVVKPKKKGSQTSKSVLSELSSLSLDGDLPSSQQAPAQDEASEDPTAAELAPKDIDSVTPPPVKVYKKRGRKSKAEMLMIKLAQGLEIDPPKPTYITKILEEPDVLEMTPGGRPQRRAAKAALVYLQELAAELSTAAPPTAPNTKPVEDETIEPADTSEPAELVEPSEPDPSSPVQKKRRRRKKKADWDEDDVSQDADFVLSEELKLHENDEIFEDDENDLFSDGPDTELASLKRSFGRSSLGKMKISNKGTSPNGLPNSIMLPVWKCSRVTMEHREEHHSPWEFPEWVPSSTKWTFLPDSEASEYMPQEVKSPLFTIRREGLREEGTYYRLNRFHCLLPHEERWDMTFFVGGPVWSMDWCPTPDGSAGCQYVALYCNMGMDDKHTLSGISQGPGLLQIWNLGQLQHETCYSSKASMTYGIALDNGCIWDLKFCPSGAWELPSTKRKNPQMARLGLLAVAFSSGFVEIYSLPHSESLHAYKQLQVKDPFHSKYTICKVQCVATLNVGSIQASSSGECGQCFCLAWLPSKPHQHIAAGFYDGTVAMWDLTTKSLLQRVRYADGLIKLYPFNCFSAHDHAVKCIEWCKVNSNFLATAGKDRKIKFWDLRRLYEPLNSIKRFLSTEITWVLPYSGVAVAQDNCYASYGLCGIHYLDTSCLGYKAYYVAPRKGTVWSISGSDWLNSIAAGDVTGEVIAAVLPDLTVNPSNVKRPSERRFPVYKADLLQCSALADKTPKEEQGESSENPDTAAVDVSDRSYKAAVTKYSILYQDTDLRHFKHYLNREPMKRMWNSESKGDLSMDRMQLESIHKVRFNPNLDSHGWLISGGQAGLVRVHCMKGLASHIGRKLIMECQTQFSTMYDNDMQDEAEYIPEVRHSVVQAE